MTDDRPSVLIIDDDVVLAGAFAQVLTREGYRVRLANSAERGLQEVAASAPDAIILDFRMPMINGTGFLYRLRASEAHQHTPVVVITGDTSLTDEVRAELRDLGATIRMKPVGVEELVATMRGLLC